MKGSLLLYNLKLNCLTFSTSLNSSLIIFIRPYIYQLYRDALDRLRVSMNIIMLCITFVWQINNYCLFLNYGPLTSSLALAYALPAALRPLQMYSPLSCF